MKIEYTNTINDVTVKVEVKFDKIDDDLFKLLSFLDFPTKEEIKNVNAVSEPLPPRPFMNPDKELIQEWKATVHRL